MYHGLFSREADDNARPTNCLHAALVELKPSEAADFWMKGEATVPLSVIMNPVPERLPPSSNPGISRLVTE